MAHGYVAPTDRGPGRGSPGAGQRVCCIVNYKNLKGMPHISLHTGFCGPLTHIRQAAAEPQPHIHSTHTIGPSSRASGIQTCTTRTTTAEKECTMRYVLPPPFTTPLNPQAPPHPTHGATTHTLAPPTAPETRAVISSRASPCCRRSAASARSPARA
eukprot:4023479-Prymnesium_polylepis.1